MEEVIAKLWRWVVLVESSLLDRITERVGSLTQAEDVINALREAEKRAKALAELEGALRALGLAVPTVDELRAEWEEAEKRGRARAPWDASQVIEEKE